MKRAVADSLEGVPAQSAVPASARVTRNALALFVGESVGRGLGFATTLVVARALGPTQLGHVAVAQSIALYLTVLGDGGLTLWSQRQIVLRPTDLSRLVCETAGVQVILGLLVMSAMALVAAFAPFPSDTSELLLLFSPYALAQALNLTYALQGLERMGTVAVVKSSAQLVTAVGTMTLVLLTHAPLWVALMLWSGQLVGDLVAVAVLRRWHGLRFERFSPARLVPLARAGLPLLAGNALAFYFTAIDVVTLGLFASADEVGRYSAPARLAFTAMLLAQIVCFAIYPEMIRRFADDRRGLSGLLDAVLKIAMRATVAGAVLVMVEAGSIVTLLFGDSYAASADVLRVIVLVVPIGWYVSILSQVSLAAGERRNFFLGLGAGALVATVALPVCAALFGAIGTAAAAVGAVTAQAICFTGLSWQYVGRTPVTAALAQLPYALGPLIVLLAFRGLGHESLVVAVGLWLAGLVVVELGMGAPTYRDVRRAARAVPTAT